VKVEANERLGPQKNRKGQAFARSVEPAMNIITADLPTWLSIWKETHCVVLEAMKGRLPGNWGLSGGA